MKIRAVVMILVFALILAFSSCGTGKEKSDVSEEPSASSGALVVYESPDASSSAEASPEPSESSDTSASPSPEPSAQATSPDEPTTEEPNPIEDQEESLISNVEFSFVIGNQSLVLWESDTDAKLNNLPLALISDDTEVLGEGSDTFTGSYLRTIKYNGLELILIAPKDNKDHSWIMQMTATGSEVQTYRGVKIDDSIETLMELYPDAERSTEDNAEEYIYTGSGDDTYTELSFIINDNAVSKMTLTYYMP